MKKIMGLVLVLMLSLSLFSGCTGGTGKNKVTDESKSENRNIVVYAPQGSGEFADWLVEQAKEQVNINVEFFGGSGGDLADRLIAEKNNPQADVALGFVQLAMYQFVEEGVLEEYIPSWSKTLPDVYKGKNDMFNCMWQTPIIIAYNEDVMSEEEAPKSWLDLADSKYKNKYAIGRLGSQTTRAYLSGILWRFYDKSTGEISQEGWDYLTKFFENSITLQEGQSLWADVASGNIPMVLSYYLGVELNSKTNEVNIGYVNSQGGTPIVSEGIALVKGGSNTEVAKEYIEWFGSPKFMAEYAKKVGSVPVHPEAIEMCPEEIKEKATLFNAQEMDWAVLAEKSNSWIEKIQLEIAP
ncbi:extracellular solute-binding protein [Vallitalea guaymasensis]|uniref:extracellular solute-binding protein n=1 Tax=Vallitalea guaymasensis TaxID=1185412 RepID=UPI002355298C|nr:extracellular solute-binding protein [Vallitalea guaymasensis]